MKWYKKLVRLILLLTMLLLLSGCTGKMNVNIKEGARFPVGSKIFFDPSRGEDSGHLQTKIVSYLLGNGYEWISSDYTSDYTADFYFGYSYSGGIWSYAGGFREMVVDDMVLIMKDKYGNVVAQGYVSGGSMNIDRALAAFFNELKRHR